MSPLNGGKAPPTKVKASSLRSFLAKLRKRHIIETLAAFIGGGWLVYEIVERVLVLHFRLPEALLDITLVILIAAMLCTILWRWFSGTEKRPGNVKVEVLIVPLIILVALAIDLNLILQMAGIPGKKLLLGIVAFLLGITWVIFKLSQWAAGMPESGKKEVEVSPPAPARPEKSIIVLPFVNISPEEGQEYFCDGMTEEIITDLSHIHDLLVISRSSAMTFKGTQKKLRDIAHDLNVRYVLEGSVRKAGNDLRIAAQLIDATNDAHLWAEKYSGSLNDVFDIQEKVSRSIVDALKLKLTPEEKQRIAEGYVDDVAAYKYYLRANQEIFKFTEVAIKQAIRYLKNALDIMGENAFLYSSLAFAYFNLVNIGTEQEDHIVKAEEFVRRALALDGEFPKAHAVLGWIENIRGNQQKAAYHLKKALAVSPVDTLALPCLAAVYFYSGKIDPAAPLCEKLMQIDPLDFATNWVQGGFYFFDGKYDYALKAWGRLHEIYPENPMSQHYYARALAYNKKIDQAFHIIDQCALANPNNMLAKLGLMLKYGILKDKDRAIHEMTPEFQMTCRRDMDGSHYLAGIFALLEEKKESLDWLENAINRGFINYPMLAEKDPFLANIRDEERFKKLMERVKYEWEHFEE